MTAWKSGAILGGLLLAATVPAGALAQTWVGSSSPEDLRYRLDVLDAELADLRARLGGTAVQPGAGGGAGVGLAEVQQFEGKLRELTRRIEQLEFQQRQLAENANRRFGDIEFRLTELEGGDLNSVANPPPLIANPQQALTAPAPAPSAQVPSIVAPVPSQGETVVASISEQGDLTRAAEDVRQGRFDQGEDRLQVFLNTYPGSPLTGEALYWLGESRFLRGNMQDAARHFLDAYQADIGGTRAPHALYRLGVTLGRLGQVNEACLTLREVRNQYPGGPSDIIRKADAEADQLACG